MGTSPGVGVSTLHRPCPVGSRAAAMRSTHMAFASLSSPTVTLNSDAVCVRRRRRLCSRCSMAVVVVDW